MGERYILISPAGETYSVHGRLRKRFLRGYILKDVQGVTTIIPNGWALIRDNRLSNIHVNLDNRTYPIKD